MGRNYIGRWKEIDFKDEYLKEKDKGKRRLTVLKSKNEYGCSSKECWSLDHCFYIWLLKHLYLYMDEASEVVDLHFHQFLFRGHQFYQDELIDMMIERLEFYFSEEYNEWDDNDAAYIREIGEIWAIILPAMWW